MVFFPVDEIVEDISRVLKPEVLHQSIPPLHESEEELLSRQDSRVVAKPEFLESEIATEIHVDDLIENRRFPVVGIDEGYWRWAQVSYDILISNAGWITTWAECPVWSKEVARDWSLVVRDRSVLNPYLPSSLRKRVYLLSSKNYVETQIDKLSGSFMQAQLRSAMQSAMTLPQIKMEIVDGGLRTHSHKEVDDLGMLYRRAHERKDRLVVFVVKRPSMQSVVRSCGLDGFTDDQAFYWSRMSQKRQDLRNFVRSHWVLECDPRISKENQVAFCWMLTPRNLVFRIETFYWMYLKYGSQIANLVAADSYQNGGGHLPLHQTKAHEQFSMSSGFREMLHAKLSRHLRMISVESAPWKAYGRM
nr:hypothetical protein [Candidatus Njordarchaeum guaymaensis]